MATVPNPRTWTVGELLTAAKMNTDLRDGLNFLLRTKPLAYLYRSAALNASYGVPIAWDAELLDRDNGHSTTTNPDRYTAQTAGWYRVNCAIGYGDAGIANEHRSIQIRADDPISSFIGLVESTMDSSGGGNPRLCASGIFPMAVGSYVWGSLLFEGGGTESIETGSQFSQFTIEWVGVT